MYITHQYKRYTLFILIKKDSDIQDVTLVHELFSYDVYILKLLMNELFILNTVVDLLLKRSKRSLQSI